MATIYTKTSLKKVKKDELIQMFLNQQAKLNDSHLATDVADHCNNLYDRIRKLKAEIEKWEYWASEVIYWSHSASKDTLQEKKLITDTNQPTIGDVRDFGEQIRDLKAENEKLKEEIKEPKELFMYKAKVKELREELDTLKAEVKFWSDKHHQMKIDYDQLDGNYKLHRKAADIYEKKLIEEIEILRKKQICDICGNAPTGY